MYWKQLIKAQDVLKSNLVERVGSDCQTKRLIKRNFLGPEFPGIYLTNREQECAFYLMQGNTLKEIARVLGLSPRTVEFYLKNVKNKLNCRTKFQIMKALLSTQWYRNSFEVS